MKKVMTQKHWFQFQPQFRTASDSVVSLSKDNIS
jgi:hypothetical protein